MVTIRNVIRGATTSSGRDPRLFIAMFGVWALLNGLSLMAPGDAFSQTPIYAVVRDLQIPEFATGVAMTLDGLAILLCLAFPRPSISSAVGISSGCCWLVWSILVFMGGARIEFYSAAAAWLFVASLVLMASTAGWIFSSEDHNGSD